MNRLNRLTRQLSWKWLYVGLGVKRWVVLLGVGTLALALGLAHCLVDVAGATPPTFADYITLRVLDRPTRVGVFGVVGIVLIAIALAKLTGALVFTFTSEDTNLAEALYRKRARPRGLKIVAMGGGTGLSTLLRGLKEHTDRLTAIVTVTDDGGSSGRLRRELGVLPPGDLRQCIAALARAEPLMTALFEYRFGEGTGLQGHAFGNLFIAAMAHVTGNFERGLQESSRVLAVRGRILPATLANVTLCAETRGTDPPMLERVAGESAVTQRGQRARIVRAYLEPEDAPAYPGVVRALLDADLIIAGPGSLYTSVIPNLLIAEVRRALEVARAPKVYVCNIATQPGETDDFSVEDHLAAIEQHIGAGIFTRVIANDNYAFALPPSARSQLVRARGDDASRAWITFADVVDVQRPWRHDPAKLARVILDWFNAQRNSA